MTRCWEAALSLLASVYLKISSRQREEAKEKRSVFPPPPWFICFPKAWRLPPVLPHSQTCLHSPESVTALTVLPFLFLIMLLLLILPVPSPILPPPPPIFFHWGWHSPEEKHHGMHQTTMSPSNIPREHKTASHLFSSLFPSYSHL